MALKIRLSRAGSKKRPYYHIVVANDTAPRDGHFLEKLGAYNPMVPKDDDMRLKLVDERVQYWLGVGAKPTDRVERFLMSKGLVPEKKRRVQTKKPLPGKKAQERQKEKQDAAS